MLFSVLIAKAGSQDGPRILETLAALRAQLDIYSSEIIVTARNSDVLTERIRVDHPHVSLHICPDARSVPQLRCHAFSVAKGEYIVVTEDHCVAPSDWLGNIDRAFAVAPPGVVAIGGPVENGLTATSLDWATFLCEYSAVMRSAADARNRSPPGMNIAYRRRALESVYAIDPDAFTQGFWETTVHPKLIADGGLLRFDDTVIVRHEKRFSFGLFVRQRYYYSRYYSGLRSTKMSRSVRLRRLALTPFLPALLLRRVLGDLRAASRLSRGPLLALPMLILFFVVWAVGEMIGYVRGGGDALRHIE